MTDLPLFFGSFHPLVVHLPIGVLLVGFLLHAVSLLRRYRHLTAALPWLYGLAALGGVVSSWSGWALAGPLGAYWDEHRWFGLGSVAATALAFALAIPLARAARSRAAGRYTRAIVLPALGAAALAVGLTGWTGHLGGAITHGSGHFAQYAPAMLRAEVSGAPEVAVVDRDTVLAYAAVVAPILEAKCVACHRAGLRQGGLDVTSYAALRAGGNEGDAIGAGTGGELWRRISLPPDHARFMPTRGAALSYDELTVLRSWLDARLDSAATVADWDPDEATAAAIARVHGIDARLLPYVDRVHPVAIDIPEMTHWRVAPLSQLHTLLEAQLLSGGDAAAAVPELATVAANVTALDLRGIVGANAFLAALPELPHLTSVDLSRSDVTPDAVLALRKTHPHLEDVNLWATPAYEDAVVGQ